MLSQTRSVNFGKTKAYATGSNGVGYTLEDSQGLIASPRTVAGVVEIITGSGMYAANIAFPIGFHGHVTWDTGTIFPIVSYATEQYNVESNDPKVGEIRNIVSSITSSISQLYDISYGRWKIDTITKQMIFYRDDNMTEVARFDLFDSSGTPSSDAVFERTKV